ncbi:uncharacterized protein PV09_08468 [Verruconis gallopava]|uniref:Formyl-CoA transferase n=1 Tax=Verruconis gallopava TaxID=253628 RepID=A0A0D1XCE5_9PEZI|nr:uncharacterized protein PV09_08468 [Verruconis gallopava]KIV99955.1 hypothetical protein PV09_08468 [Verruconis gallopava]
MFAQTLRKSRVPNPKFVIFKGSYSRCISIAARDASRERSGPLAGLRVLDLSRILAGPFCTQLLADYGADVIKIEQPGTGDDTRHWRAKGEADHWLVSSPMSFYFTAVNRNKRSMTLDLKKQTGLNILYDLVKRSDVLVENFVPGKSDELGFGYDKVRSLNSRLVYASISGYGASGPYSTRAGYDAIAAAEGGLMHITGEADGKPLRPGLGMVDMSTGMLMHGAILAALRARDTTGRGQKLDVSLFETQLSLLINIGVNWLNMGIEGRRYGAAHPSICPYDTYRTKDGYLALGANNEKQWHVLCDRLGRNDLREDRRFGSNPLRVQNREVLDEILKETLLQKTNAEWLATLENSGLAHGPVNTIQKAFEHPQAQARDMVQEKESAYTAVGKIMMIGPPVKFSEDGAGIRTIAPLLGEHTEDVLRELGYDGQQIGSLRKQGVV